jgi:CBS domain-containing protein
VIHPIARPWLIPVITTLGGLLCGLMVYTFASKAEGHGTDAAIEAFHYNGGKIRTRIPPIKLLASAITIGSGGVFGPGMVIGGFLGAAIWSALHTFAPWMLGSTPPGAFAVVGMGAFFGGVGKAPLAVILMVAEMTGEFSLIVPAMLATMIAYLITGETSIYESQLDTRLDSPAHKDDYALPLLQSMTVRQALGPGLATAAPETSAGSLLKLLRDTSAQSVPIVEDQRLVGLVTASYLARLLPADTEVVRARQIVSRRIVYAYPDESLYDAWLRMTRRGLRQLAVVERGDTRSVVGIVTLKDIARLLRQPIDTSSVSSAMSRTGVGLAVAEMPGSKSGSADGHQAAVPELAPDEEYPTETLEDDDIDDTRDFDPGAWETQDASPAAGAEEPTGSSL